MLQESTTLRAILTNEPLADGFQKLATTAPELHVVRTDRLITDIASVTSGGTQPRLADRISGLLNATASETLEAVFASAIREVIPTLVQRWANSHEAELSSAFSAIVQRWMDERLPKGGCCAIWTNGDGRVPGGPELIWLGSSGFGGAV